MGDRRVRDGFEDAEQLAFKMEYGTMSQGLQVASGSLEKKGNRFFTKIWKEKQSFLIL